MSIAIRVRSDECRVRDMALLGMTDEEICERMGISTVEFEKWLLREPLMRKALDDGREVADGLVVNALLKRAVGYEENGYKIVMVGGIPTRIEVKKQVPADVGAALAWLRVKRPQVWGDAAVPIAKKAGGKFRLPAGMSEEAKKEALAAVDLLMRLDGGEGGGL